LQFLSGANRLDAKQKLYEKIPYLRSPWIDRQPLLHLVHQRSAGQPHEHYHDFELADLLEVIPAPREGRRNSRATTTGLSGADLPVTIAILASRTHTPFSQTGADRAPGALA
jgi:hypothetical protein